MNSQLKTNSLNFDPDPGFLDNPENFTVLSNQKIGKSLKEKGKDENIKNLAEKKELDKQKLNDLVKKSNRCIISVSSIFPWNIFPNTVEVEESRVNIITRQFMSSQTHSVEIKDISNVFLDSSFFFAKLKIVSRTYVENEIRINYLNKERAKRAKMIIEGLRIFKNNDIDTSNYEVDELVNKLEELHTNIPEEKLLPFLGQQET